MKIKKQPAKKKPAAKRPKKRLAVFMARNGVVCLRGDATPDEIERTFG